MALNTWAASILRFGTGILKWNKNELQEIDRKTRRFMTMNKELHPRNDVARLYVSRKNGGRGLIGCEFFFFFFFLTAIWLTHGQLWAILKGTASLTRC